MWKKDLHSSDNGSTFIQNNEYAYNERGWMTKINDPNSVTATKAFGMELAYGNTADSYNGNISSMSWQTRVPAGLGLSQQLQSYSYTYDKLNRLTSAAYNSSGATDKFNEELSYDEMGNILTLKRKNVTTANTFLNNLTYNYTNAGVKSNRLLGVSDAGTAAQTSNYTYDDNGNQKTDSRKGISISYNHLNLPQTITKASTSETMSYVYDGTGKRLRKIVGTNNRDYIDGIEYNNGAIEFIQTEEGRAIPGTAYTYEYLLKDHLGNTRAGVRQDGSIVQVQDYYAFGMEMNPGKMFSSSPVNQYKYNGKEKQNELGLEQYDYGARFYDPVIGRWNVVDALAENHFSVNPYNYVLNNPINTIDPYGLDTIAAKNVVWNNFNTNKDEIGLNEVSITANKGEAKAKAAYNQILDEVQGNYKKSVGGLFQGYPDNLKYVAADVFYRRYIKYNEINPFTGQGRVVGLEDANWIIDLAAGGIVSLTKTGAALATKAGVSEAQITLNRAAGNAFRDELAAGLTAEGRDVTIEVFKRTPFGPRYIDIEVGYGGKVLGGIETKVGASRYHPLQRIKDIWLDVNTPGGYPIQVVRKTQ